jgi:D-arginine dehydrogenase
VQPGLFWLAALGGYGIQTAPALSRLAASLALRKRDDEDLLPGSVALASLRPDRFLAKVAAQM